MERRDESSEMCIYIEKKMRERKCSHLFCACVRACMCPWFDNSNISSLQHTGLDIVYWD